MRITLHLVSTIDEIKRGSSHDPEPTPPKSIIGSLLGPILPFSSVRVRCKDGRIVETSPVLRQGTGWIATLKGTYAINFEQDQHTPQSFKGRVKSILSYVGPTWTDPEGINNGFYRIRERAIKVVGLTLNESFGYAEFFSEKMIRPIELRASEYSAQSGVPANLYRTALQASISVSSVYPLMQLCGAQMTTPLVAISRMLRLAAPNLTPSTVYPSGAQNFDLQYFVVVRGEQVLYTLQEELSIPEKDLIDCERWIEKRAKEEEAA